MPRIRPEFTKIPYFVDEPGNWRLKSGAPIELQAEFNQYMSNLEIIDDEAGTIIGIHIRFPYSR